MSTTQATTPAPARPEPQMPSACATGGCGCGSGGGSGGGGQTAVVRLHRRGEPASPQPPAYRRVAINGVEIPAEAIAEEVQQHPAPSPVQAWAAAARALAIRELLLQEARRLGLHADPEADEAGRAELEDEALIRALLEREAPPAQPSREECLRVYEARRASFRTPPLTEAAHILIEPQGEDEAAWGEALRQARIIAAEVGHDAAAFAEAARAFSGCPSRHQGGSLGQLQPGELVPEVQAALDALAEGTTRPEPVRSRYGWHVLRLARRIEGRQLPFEMVERHIVDMLEARSWAAGAARYTAALASRAQLEGVELDAGELEAQLLP
jgi:peptidyl-prolyl cis-trans isomerase C